MGSTQTGQDPDDLLARQNDGQPRRRARALDVLEPRELVLEDVAVQKQNRAFRLILRGRGDAAPDREVGQECLDVRGSELRRVALAVIDDEAFNPVDVRLLGADAVMLEADLFAHPVEQARGPGSGTALPAVIRKPNISR